MRAAVERHNDDGSVDVLVAVRVKVTNSEAADQEQGYRLRVKMAPDDGTYKIAKLDQVTLVTAVARRDAGRAGRRVDARTMPLASWLARAGALRGGRAARRRGDRDAGAAWRTWPHRSARLAVVGVHGGRGGSSSVLMAVNRLAAAGASPDGAWAAALFGIAVHDSVTVRRSALARLLARDLAHLLDTACAVRRMAVAAVGFAGAAHSPICCCAPRCDGSSRRSATCAGLAAIVLVAAALLCAAGSGVELSGGIPARPGGR